MSVGRIVEDGMLKPQPGSRRERIWQVFVSEGGMTLDTLIANYGMFSFKKVYELRSELQTLINYRCLKLLGNVYFPTTVAEQKKKELNIVPSREPREFKPLKNPYPTVSPRGQKIERRSFKTCTSDIEPSWRNLE